MQIVHFLCLIIDFLTSSVVVCVFSIILLGVGITVTCLQFMCRTVLVYCGVCIDCWLVYNSDSMLGAESVASSCLFCASVLVVVGCRVVRWCNKFRGFRLC